MNDNYVNRQESSFLSSGYTNKYTGAAATDYFLNRKIKAAIFDIDGTLLDSMPLWDSLGARYLQKRGKTPEPGLRDILFPMTIKESVRYLKCTYSLPETEDEIRSGLFRITETFYRDEVPLKKGAFEFLTAFHKAAIPMVLCTIGEADLEKAALSRLDVLSFFQEIFICEEYQTTKKESKIYNICAEHLQSLPAETVVFEDILQAVQSAKNGGYLTAAVEDAASSSDKAKILDAADCYLTDFTELFTKPIKNI